MHPDIAAALERAHIQLEADRADMLERYTSWLRTEGIRAGGIGPREADVVENRHIADALLYLPERSAGSLLDLGSGIGLPGLVLAIAHPELDCTLVDRSGRRLDLLRRAVRVLGIENVEVVAADVERYHVPADIVTMRAVLPPLEAIPVMTRLALHTAVLGLSRHHPPDGRDDMVGTAQRLGFAATVVESRVLEPPAWLLIMTRT